MSKPKRKYKPLPTKLVAWWHPTLNGELKPEDVSPWSSQVVWFRHYDRKWKQWHEWDSALDSISQRENCPICTGSRLIVGINDLATRNPTVAKMWHQTLNGYLTAQMVTEHSGETRWWQHKDKKTGLWHEWPAKVENLTKKKPNTCSVCNGNRIQLGVNDLATTHAYLASEWHPTLNGDLTPEMITKGMDEEIWWTKDCFDNGIYHVWHARPSSRTGKKPQGCAICGGQQVQLGVNDLGSQRPDIAREWDQLKNKNLTPEMVTVSSGKKVHWKHETKDGSMHSWSAVVEKRTRRWAPTGCPKPECAKYGFDPAKPAQIYVLLATIQETQVIQFGVSNDIKTRLARHTLAGFISPPIVLWEFAKGMDTLILETSLKHLMCEYGIPTAAQRGIKFSGSTESFCLEDADDEFLEEFKELVGLSEGTRI